MTIFNFESVWRLKSITIWGLGSEFRLLVSPILYIFKKKKKKNHQWAIRYLLSVNYARAHSSIKPTMRFKLFGGI